MYYIGLGAEHVPTSIQPGDEMVVTTYRQHPAFWAHRRGVGPLWMLQRDGTYTRVFGLVCTKMGDPILSIAHQYGAWATGSGLGWEEIQDRVGFRRYFQGRRKFRAKPVENP